MRCGPVGSGRLLLYSRASGGTAVPDRLLRRRNGHLHAPHHHHHGHQHAALLPVVPAEGQAGGALRLCWAGCDPADVLRGGVDAAAGDERLYVAPVSDGRPAAGATWQRRQLAHLPKAAEGASRVFRQKDHLGGTERGGGTGAEKEARCKAGIRSGPDAGAGYLPHRGPVWPGKLRNGSRCVP